MIDAIKRWVGAADWVLAMLLVFTVVQLGFVWIYSDGALTTFGGAVVTATLAYCVGLRHMELIHR